MQRVADDAHDDVHHQSHEDCAELVAEEKPGRNQNRSHHHVERPLVDGLHGHGAEGAAELPEGGLVAAEVLAYRVLLDPVEGRGWVLLQVVIHVNSVHGTRPGRMGEPMPAIEGQHACDVVAEHGVGRAAGEKLSQQRPGRDADVHHQNHGGDVAGLSLSRHVVRELAVPGRGLLPLPSGIGCFRVLLVHTANPQARFEALQDLVVVDGVEDGRRVLPCIGQRRIAARVELEPCGKVVDTSVHHNPAVTSPVVLANLVQGERNILLHLRHR